MNKTMVSIRGLDKAAVLAALYNRATADSVYSFPGVMTVERAREILSPYERVTKRILFWEIEKRPAVRHIGFYIRRLGERRIGEVEIFDEEFDPYFYDRYNGSGAAAEAIETLRQTGDVNPPASQAARYASEVTVFRAWQREERRRKGLTW